MALLQAVSKRVLEAEDAATPARSSITISLIELHQGLDEFRAHLADLDEAGGR